MGLRALALLVAVLAACAAGQAAAQAGAVAPAPAPPPRRVPEDDGVAAAPTVHLREPGVMPPPAPRTPGADGGALPAGVHAPRRPGEAPLRPRVPLRVVAAMSAVMAAMSCLGVVPYFFVSRLSKPWAGLANAVASGVMLAASFGLLSEGAPYGGMYLILGMLLGVLFVKFSQEHLEQYEVDSFEQLAGADARKVILFLAVMAVHAVGEGGGVGVSFAGERGWAQGTLVTLAIGLHNVPEGLAVATVMAAKGTSPRRTLLWTALTALPQALVAPPAYAFVETFRALLPLAMGFAAGCMIWVVLAELIPDALEVVEPERVATCATGSAAWLQGLSIWIGHLETPAGTLASPFGDYQAVLQTSMAQLLLQLAPVAIAPALLAAGASRLAWSHPLLLSACAGLLASYSAAAWLQLLATSDAWLVNGLGMPLLGAAAAAALWRQLSGAGGSAGGCSVAAALEQLPLGCGGSSMKGHAAPAAREDSLRAPSAAQAPCLGGAHGAQAAAAPAGTHGRPGAARADSVILTAPAAHHLGTTLARLPRSSDNGRDGGWDGHTAAGAGGCLVAPQHPQLSLSVASTWEPASAASSTCSNSPPVRGAAASPRLAGRGGGGGELLLPTTVAAAAGGCALDHGCTPSAQRKAASVPARPGQAVAGAGLMGLGGVVAAGVPLGLQLATALAAGPASMSHLLAPMMLLGCLFGAACFGFLLLLLGPRAKQLGAAAGLVSATPVLVAVGALLSQPAWVQQGHVLPAADGLQGLAAGFNVLLLQLVVQPLARRWGPASAALGLGCGSGVGLLLCCGLAALCGATPYCLRRAPVFGGAA